MKNTSALQNRGVEFLVNIKSFLLGQFSIFFLLLFNFFEQDIARKISTFIKSDF